MWKITATSALSVLFVSGVLAAPQGHRSWTMTQVLERGALIGITNSERALGLLWTDAAPTRLPFIWHRGNLVYLPQDFSPNAINDSGRIVGSVPAPADGGPRAALWDQGTMVDLSTWPLLNGEGSTGYRSVANGVNNLGQVVGSAGKAVLWSNGSAFMLYGPGPSTATDINDSGQIVGWYSLAMSFNHRYVREYALIWQGESLQALGSPLPGARRTQPVAINNSGQVVGWSSGADGLPHAILWGNGPTILLAPGAFSSVPTAINARGQVVGYASDGTRTRAFVWHEGVFTVLPSDGDARATDINDRGDIIGNIGADADTSKGVLWTR